MTADVSAYRNIGLPPCVTRFYGKVDFALDVITNLRLAFVHTSLMNDPFDPYCFFETDFGDSYQNLLRYVRANHPADIRWFGYQVTAQSWGVTVRDLKEYLEILRGNMFMLSTSAATDTLHPKDNLYMWGHYGAGHRGVALEFDTEKLTAAVLQHHQSENKTALPEQPIWGRVEYTETFSAISMADVFEFLRQEKLLESRRKFVRSGTRLEKYYDRMSVVKSTVWREENEWRLLWHNETKGAYVYKCPISPECVSNIFIGMRFAGELDTFVNEARRALPSAGLYLAKKRHGNLALDYERL